MFGKISFDGLVQAWYLGSGKGFDDTLRIRRTELKLSGSVAPRAKWTLMVDPAKALSIHNGVITFSGSAGTLRGAGAPGQIKTRQFKLETMLQDLYVTLAPHSRVNLNVGRFKIPLGLEGLQSSAELDTERAMFSSDRARGGTYGDVRDLGVMAFGSLVGRLNYQVGVFGGNGSPHNNRNAVAARVTYRSANVPGLELGTSAVWGSATAAQMDGDRQGAEMRYVSGPLTLQAEYMTGTDGPIERTGHYGHVAYKLTPRVEGALRYDSWDPDRRSEATAASVTERDYIAALSYYVPGSRVTVQFNYVRRTFAGNLMRPVNLGVGRLQTSW